MKILTEEQNSFSLILETGEDFIEILQNFCAERNIKSGWLEAVGSASALELSYYDRKKKSYDAVEFSEDVEILNITGNAALKEDKIFIHAHGVFGRWDMSTFGGHVNKCMISATCEVHLWAGNHVMKRKFDKHTGLYLLE